MGTVVRCEGTSHESLFAKVRSLLVDAIERLADDAQADASHVAYCDMEAGESFVKKGDKDVVIDRLSTKIGFLRAKSAQIKGQVAGFQAALADLAKAQSKMSKMRSEVKAQYARNTP